MTKSGRSSGSGLGHFPGYPSTTGNPSGGGRANDPPGGLHSGGGHTNSAGWPSTTGNPSGGGRDNNPPGGK